MSEAEDKQFESLLSYLQQNRGFDFTGYKRPSLMRRVSRRMQMLEVGSLSRCPFLVCPDSLAAFRTTVLGSNAWRQIQLPYESLPSLH